MVNVATIPMNVIADDDHYQLGFLDCHLFSRKQNVLIEPLVGSTTSTYPSRALVNPNAFLFTDNG